jgi:hypothetical protein
MLCVSAVSQPLLPPDLIEPSFPIKRPSIGYRKTPGATHGKAVSSHRTPRSRETGRVKGGRVDCWLKSTFLIKDKIERTFHAGVARSRFPFRSVCETKPPTLKGLHNS